MTSRTIANDAGTVERQTTWLLLVAGQSKLEKLDRRRRWTRRRRVRLARLTKNSLRGNHEPFDQGAVERSQ